MFIHDFSRDTCEYLISHNISSQSIIEILFTFKGDCYETDKYISELYIMLAEVERDFKIKRYDLIHKNVRLSTDLVKHILHSYID